MSNIRTVLLITVFLLCFSNFTFAAQSTSDVPVTPELVSSARDKVFGKQQTIIKSDEEYVIGHGDILNVQVYGEGDMSAAAPSFGRGGGGSDELRNGVSGVQVRIDGRISLQHLGDIEAVGFTPTQLADFLKDLYATVYEDPIITVVLIKSNSQRYTVMGKVVRPGIYFLDFPINIVQAIARSGGFTEWAKSEITLVRKVLKKNRELFKGNKLLFDYDNFLEGKNLERNVLIQPNDIIIVH